MIALVTGCIGLAVALTILLLMRKDKLHAAHGLAWFAVALLFACLGFAPGIVDMVAGWVGIEYPPILALSTGMSLLVLKMLLMDIERSRIEVRNQRLTQRIAMLETELQSHRASEFTSVGDNTGRCSANFPGSKRDSGRRSDDQD
ncbi:MAG: DUF2304 domain-containing protein [Halieaceae bacterium]|jgi:hypothetical protein|nr:DUF2304 domain-containing protein [Halieaceae bacterium]